MTSKEYEQVLGEMTEPQRRTLNDYISKGNQATIVQMVHTFERCDDVESKAVFWLKQNVPGFQHETQAHRVAEANIRSAKIGQQSLAVSKKSLTVAYCALAIAVLALLASIIAVWK
jgi:hypothetical protein